MNYTWGEIQILSIQKMFLNNAILDVANLDTYRADRKYNLYLTAMPAVANEGLLRLMTVGRPIIKKYTLSFDIPDEIFDYKSNDVIRITNEDVIISGLISRAYYFEINNNATIEIQKKVNDAWTVIKTITHISSVSGSYEMYKGNITNEEDEIRIVFKKSNYLYNVRNIALYNINFINDDNIYSYTKTQKYDLKTLINDFYDIVSIEYEKENEKGHYDSDYILESDNTLIIDSTLKGNFIITYKAYPSKITSNTPDTYRFTLPSEMIAILPLYIASELYKDDDVAQATIYRNEFEISLSNIKTTNNIKEFANNANWL